MVSVLTSSAVGRECQSQSGQTKDYNWYLLLYCKAHSIKEKEQRLIGSESESEWSDMSTRGLLFQ